MAIQRILRWRASAILNFCKFEILLADRVQRVKMRHAKFRGNQSNYC